MSKPNPDPVAEYYNRNTRNFLRFGAGKEAAAIHRQIWAPGVETRQQASQYLNRMVADQIRPALTGRAGTPHVIDLGCGAGGTSVWIAQALDVEVSGVTNSPVQLEIARQYAEQLGLGPRCRFILGNFLALPALELAQAAWAIESFVHASDPAAFFSESASHLVSGGRLVICDDFLARPRAEIEAEPRARLYIWRFEHGWQIASLLHPDQLVEFSGEAGFRLLSCTDLSLYLRGFHPIVLQLTLLLTHLPFKSPFWQNLSGGAALQLCYRRGWTHYLVFVLEKI